MWYDGSELAKLFSRLFQSVTYFSAFHVIIFLKKYFKKFVAQILLDSFNYFLKFNQSLAPQIACKSLRLSEARFVFD